MASQGNDMVGSPNKFLLEIIGNLKFFAQNIMCVRETFDSSQALLKKQLDATKENLAQFIQLNNISQNDGKVVISKDKRKSYLNLQRIKERAEQAVRLIPPSYLVSLVSLFDSFYAGLVRCIYNLNPEKLLESDMKFTYRDLKDLDSIREVKQVIVESKIENLLRDSHIEQFKWLASAMEVSTLTQFNGWSDFVELTERRNLFVHANGKVSAQYVTICKKYEALQEGVSIGTILGVDKSYFEKAFKNLYKIAIMLSHILASNNYLKKFEGDLEAVDKHLVNCIFELISGELYDVAIEISEFSLKHPFRHKTYDKCWLILNLAQSFKWQGKQDKCMEVIRNEDSSGWRDEFLLPKYVLEDNFVKAYELMRKIGNGNSVITASAYRGWPIFKEIRKEENFCSLFQEIFGEPVKENVNVETNNANEVEEALIQALQ